MFENIGVGTIVTWILGWVVSRYLIPYLMKSDTFRRSIKVVDRPNGEQPDATDASFDWKTAEPPQYRPFKPIYHLTMGIARVKESDTLLMEKSYGDIIDYKKRVVEEEPTETCLVSREPQVSRKVAQATATAVEELYDHVIGLMLWKYPAYFVASGNVIVNLVTGDEIPRRAATRDKTKFPDPRDLLKLICNNVEEDFLIMQADPSQDNEYVLRAATGIAANGFRTSEKMNKKLTTIHDPVPQYVEKLQLSMNRHFQRIEPGNFVQRLTWGIQVGGGINELFRPSGQHLNANEKVVEELDGSKLDFANGVFVRVERQVLTKLAKSKFIVLSIRTYMYPLETIKKEGTAETLAKAIRAWPEDLAHYKGRPRWGKAVLEYLDAV